MNSTRKLTRSEGPNLTIQEVGQTWSETLRLFDNWQFAGRGVRSPRTARYPIVARPMRLFPTREAKLAHWVNVYSVRILRIVVDNYPTTSITSFGLVPCGAFFVKRGRSPTTAVTLDEQGHRNMLSEIFEEYGSGFTEALGAGSGGKKTARDCLKLYLNEERLEKLQRLSGAKNAYHDYDWGLNDRATMLAQEPSR